MMQASYPMSHQAKIHKDKDHITITLVRSKRAVLVQTKVLQYSFCKKKMELNKALSKQGVRKFPEQRCLFEQSCRTKINQQAQQWVHVLFQPGEIVMDLWAPTTHAAMTRRCRCIHGPLRASHNLNHNRTSACASALTPGAIQRSKPKPMMERDLT